MQRRLRILIDFYQSPSALLFLVGLGAFLLRLVNVGPQNLMSLLAVVCVGVGLPLRIHSQTSGLYLVLEEERQFTHRRLAALETKDPTASLGD